MRLLNCDCGFQVKGKDDEEVMQIAREHSRNVHQHEVTKAEEKNLLGQIKTM